jgi:hypothetical protein
MASIDNVTAARLISCNIQGVKPSDDVTRLVRTITIKESVCSPYLTGEILLLDNDNVINVSDVPGGTRIDLTFDGAGKGSGPSYHIDMYILHITATPSPENFNLQIYTISMVSSEYFTDRGQTVTIGSQPFENGCALIKKIWTECGFKWPLDQILQDLPFQTGNQPYTCTMAKPFTAIGQIRNIQVYPLMDGNVMFFHNRSGGGSVHQVVHGPLHQIYHAAVSNQTFIQKETWGIDYKHLFGGDKSYHSIIALNQQSRDVMLDPDEYSADTQITVSTDQHAGKQAANKILSGIAQGHGINIPHSNSDRVESSQDPYNIIARARAFAHCMKAVPPKYLVRVPLKTGLNITVGEGCTLDLQPTHANPNSKNPHSGDYFITDLVHEVHNDLREVNGTTTFNALMKGYC